MKRFHSNLNGLKRKCLRRARFSTAQIPKDRIEGFLTQKQFNLAQELCDGLLANPELGEPERVSLLTLRAKSFLKRKRFFEARVDLEKAKKIEPYSEEVWLTMAEVTSWLRLHREAVTMLRPLLAMKNERALKLQDWLLYRAKQSVGDYRDCDKIPEHEIEECVGPVNIAPTRMRGRGLVVTKDVKQNELLWVERSLVEMEMTVDDPEKYNDLLIQKLQLEQKSNTLFRKRLHALFKGNAVRPPSIILFKNNYHDPRNAPDLLSEDDLRQLLKFNVNIMPELDEEGEGVPESIRIGIWPLLSFINHGPSALDIAPWKGLIFVRSAKAMKKGAMLTLPFEDPSLSEAKQQDILEEKHDIII